MGWTTRCFDTCMYWYEKKNILFGLPGITGNPVTASSEMK